jgi:hypothetical protein
MQHEHHRVDDLDLPRACRQRQALAGRADGAALGCGGDVEAGKQFRRVNGYLHLPALRAALEAEVAKTVTGSCKDQEEVEAA